MHLPAWAVVDVNQLTSNVNQIDDCRHDGCQAQNGQHPGGQRVEEPLGEQCPAQDHQPDLLGLPVGGNERLGFTADSVDKRKHVRAEAGPIDDEVEDSGDWQHPISIEPQALRPDS